MIRLSHRIFVDEAAALAFVEAQLWPKGPVCPHCQNAGRIARLKGTSTRFGTYKCYACRKPFTVKVGTMFESSHVPMHLWLRAIYLLSTNERPLSANQLHRALGVTPKTAGFMKRRIERAINPTLETPHAASFSASNPDVAGPRSLASALRARTRTLQHKRRRPVPLDEIRGGTGQQRTHKGKEGAR